jgi:hypothetical protein
VADFVFNIAKGRFVYYATLPAASDALILVPIEASGVEADDTLNNYDDLATLLAASNNEQTANMGRKTITSVTVTVDDTNNRADVDFADPVWTGATGNAVSDLLTCYDGDTGTGGDANIIPLTCHDFSVTPDGSNITAVLNASGLARAS